MRWRKDLSLNFLLSKGCGLTSEKLGIANNIFVVGNTAKLKLFNIIFRETSLSNWSFRNGWRDTWTSIFEGSGYQWRRWLFLLSQGSQDATAAPLRLLLWFALVTSSGRTLWRCAWPLEAVGRWTAQRGHCGSVWIQRSTCSWQSIECSPNASVGQMPSQVGGQIVLAKGQNLWKSVSWVQ